MIRLSLQEIKFSLTSTRSNSTRPGVYFRFMMKKKIHFLLFTSLWWLMISCVGQQDGQPLQQAKYDLQLKDSLVIPIDVTTKPKSRQLQYLEKEQLLVALNENKNSLQFYDLRLGKLVKKIKFEREGPQGVGNLNGFLVAGGYYYLLNSYKYQLFQFDTLGNKLQKYSLLKANQQPGQGTATPFAMTSRPPFLNGDMLYLRGATDVFAAHLKPSDERQLIALNLTDGAYQYLVPGPKEYDGKEMNINLSMREPTFFFITEQVKVVFSHRYSEYLYVYDLKSGKQQRYPAKTKHFKQVNQMIATGDGGSDNLDFYRENSCYSTVVYDKYRKVYYRFVEMPSKKALEMKSIFVFEYRNLAVIILDENFNQVGETAVLPPYHDQNNFFVTQKGLYLRKFTDNEDEMVFSRFELLKR
ncbi:MAG TPA: hypothetical protein DCM08_00740 [Microscillaceae bacterium]|nr:hypothetical protein [Microscillaceae bacterium]